MSRIPSPGCCASIWTGAGSGRVSTRSAAATPTPSSRRTSSRPGWGRKRMGPRNGRQTGKDAGVRTVHSDDMEVTVVFPGGIAVTLGLAGKSIDLSASARGRPALVRTDLEPRPLITVEIGRASCRERVEITVAGGVGKVRVMELDYTAE